MSYKLSIVGNILLLPVGLLMKQRVNPHHGVRGKRSFSRGHSIFIVLVFYLENYWKEHFTL